MTDEQAGVEPLDPGDMTHEPEHAARLRELGLTPDGVNLLRPDEDDGPLPG
jgi:hypothetical protein